MIFYIVSCLLPMIASLFWFGYNVGQKRAKYIVNELAKVKISNSEKARIAREQISEVYPEFLGKKTLNKVSGFLAEKEYRKIKK